MSHLSFFSFFHFAENQLAAQARSRQTRNENQIRRTQQTDSQQVYRGATTPTANTVSLQMDTRQQGGLYDMLSSQTQTQNSSHGTYGGSDSYNSADQFDQGKLQVMPDSNFADTLPSKTKTMILVSDGAPL